jgi:hypothetical protein
MDNVGVRSCGCLPAQRQLFRSEKRKSIVALQRQAFRAAQAHPLQLQGMPIKPGARQCYIREQIVEDLPSGLTLQFEAFEGGVRLTIASKALPANREIVFDTEGAASKTGPSKRLH